MSHSTTAQPVGQITGAPFITLVDIDGCPVGYGEKNIPAIDREPCPADSWPAWTDILTVKLGRRDFDLQAGSVRMADAFDRVMERVDAGTGEPDDFNAALEADDDAMPLPEMPDVRAPEDWPDSFHDAPDASPFTRFPGIGSLAERGIQPMPIAGGSPDAEPAPYEPTPEDWADYRNHFDRIDAPEAMFGYE